MKPTKVERYILYTLGKWFEEANKKIQKKPLKVSISKVHFIELLIKAKIAGKQTRALYRNLESLEKRKFLSYQYKELKLTKKGREFYKRIKAEVEPYVLVTNTLKGKRLTSYTRKLQTIFK